MISGLANHGIGGGGFNELSNL